MLSFLYPRMDYNVSTMQNHLLKLPFSVHPSSRRISIPLFKRQLVNFDPKKCVTIKDLLRNVEEFAKEGRDSSMQGCSTAGRMRRSPRRRCLGNPSRPWRSSLALCSDGSATFDGLIMSGRGGKKEG